MLKFKEIAKGDFFSENPYYQVEKVHTDSVDFKVLGTDQIINVDNEIIEANFHSSDIYSKEVMLTKTGKKDGSAPGIRQVFEEYGSDICTVVFYKADTKKSKTVYKKELGEQASKAAALIEKARSGKKSMLTAAVEEISKIQANPILDFIPGELRVMTGYKIGFTSTDGKYAFMDVEKGQQRLVNINTIVSFTGNDTKYYLKGFKNA